MGVPVGGKKKPLALVIELPLNTEDGTVPLLSWLALFVLMLFVEIVVRFPAVAATLAVAAAVAATAMVAVPATMAVAADNALLIVPEPLN